MALRRTRLLSAPGPSLHHHRHGRRSAGRLLVRRLGTVGRHFGPNPRAYEKRNLRPGAAAIAAGVTAVSPWVQPRTRSVCYDRPPPPRQARRHHQAAQTRYTFQRATGSSGR